MAGNTKNVGQVAGIHVGTTPPQNVRLIWWDSTPSQQCHKVYDYNLKDWVILDQGILSTITYTELRNIALQSGLSVGKFFIITDKGSVLALSITKTKIQYVDVSGNLLVDDLGSNVTYFVSSNNLTLDGENGQFNSETTKLNFEFVEVSEPSFNTAYIYGKDRESENSNTMRLIKFKLSSLLSTVTGNDLKWNKGIYFNFSSALLELGDKSGGVVLHDTYVKEQEVQDQSIENIANNYSALLTQMTNLITQQTSDANILNKKITALSVGGEPTDAAAGDTLYTVLSKFQRYINKFKYATGIKVSTNFTESTVPEKVNNNDTVDSALRKLQYWLSHIGTLNISSDWEPKDYAGTVPDIAAGDTIDEAFAKAQGKLNQIGLITNGVVNSREFVNGSSSTRRTTLDFKNGALTFRKDVTSPGSQVDVYLSKTSGLRIVDTNSKGMYAAGDGVSVNTPTSQQFTLPAYERTFLGSVVDYIVGAASMVVNGQGTTPFVYNSVGVGAALSALCVKGSLSSNIVFDAYFARLKSGGLSFGTQVMSDTDIYLDTDCSFVSCLNQENKNVFLPTAPAEGQFVIINQVNSANIAVQGNGKKIVDNENVDYINIGGARRLAVFLYNASIAMGEGQSSGGWLFARWTR
jgi:hypothetical protein